MANRMDDSTWMRWFAPAVMVGALITGIFCALGHHLFYAHLAGTTAPTGQFNIAGTSISTQQLNTAIGTAFGFLVKSFLTVTTATAFVQAFWRAIRTSINGPTLGSLDNAFSAMSNLLGLLDFKAWRGFPIPFLLACIAWIVPIASIVTPATLSVQANPVEPAPVHMMTVPQLDFTSQNFAAPIPRGSRGYCFNGPSQNVERVAAAVAAQGQILPIEAPGPNVTWTADFSAPSLSCSDVEDPERASIWDHILEQWGNVTDCSYAYGYMAWAATANSSLPLIQHQANSSSRVLESAQMTYDAPASIYVAALPQMLNFAFMPSASSTQEKCRFFGSDSLIYSYPIADDVCLPGLQPPACYGQNAWLTKATLLKCDLVNATYHTSFQYKDGAQNITVDLADSAARDAQITARECIPTNYSSTEADARLTSYQGISYAFNQLVLGSITMGGYGTPARGVSSKLPGVVLDSRIATTVLMETEDLAFVVKFNGVNQTFDTWQTVEANNFPSRTDIRTGRRGDLKSALEMLFQNITLSLLSDEMLQPNYSSPYAPEAETAVTSNTFHNVYVYSASTLWVAYGLAILLTLVALALGVSATMLNQGSFTSDFSTVLRTSRAAELSEEVRGEERSGIQPLPKRLATARIKIDVDAGDKTSEGFRWNRRETKEAPTAKTSLLSLRRKPD